jgi:hypothetical protein
MKHLLSSLPLLVTAVAIVSTAVVVALNLSIITPDVFGIGAGLFTCAGLLSMVGVDAPRDDYC